MSFDKKIGKANRWLLIGVIGLALGAYFWETLFPASTEVAVAQASTDECETDVRCVADKRWMDADLVCKSLVENLASYSHEWTNSWGDRRFPRAHWADADRSVITYSGRSIKFQNGFGAWQNQSYECDFDPETGAALGARAEPSNR